MIRKFAYRAAALLAVPAFALAGGMSGLHSGHAAPQSAAVAYKNPVFSRPFPDPMVLRLNAHDYYAYGTTVS